MLVVLSIVSLISVFGLNFFVTTLKGSAKSTVTAEIKQNGNYALDVMSYYIRNASAITACSSSSISVRQWDNSEVTFTLVNTDPNINSYIASNSSILTNTNQDNGVSVTDLTFVCSENTPPEVKINFTISQTAWAPNRKENQASVDFQTTVALRTY